MDEEYLVLDSIEGIVCPSCGQRLHAVRAISAEEGDNYECYCPECFRMVGLSGHDEETDTYVFWERGCLSDGQKVSS